MMPLLFILILLNVTKSGMISDKKIMIKELY